jgi:hypothetical protein
MLDISWGKIDHPLFKKKIGTSNSKTTHVSFAIGTFIQLFMQKKCIKNQRYIFKMTAKCVTRSMLPHITVTLLTLFIFM